MYRKIEPTLRILAFQRCGRRTQLLSKQSWGCIRNYLDSTSSNRNAYTQLNAAH